jgi:hypothetical protein
MSLVSRTRGKRKEKKHLIERILRLIEREGDYHEFWYKGRPCKIVRHRELLHLCGYVGVPRDSPLYMIDYDEAFCGEKECNLHTVEWFVKVHGGVTFSGWLDKEDNYWYFGFDCAHVGDLVPKIIVFSQFGLLAEENSVYRDMKYVKRQCKILVKQILELEDYVSRNYKSSIRRLQLMKLVR